MDYILRLSNSMIRFQSPVPLTVLLLLAALAIMILAWFEMTEDEHYPGELTSDVVARVDNRVITRANFESALSLMAADKREPLTDADRRLILDLMIDEDLLMMEALDSGLAEREPAIRKAMIRAVIDSVAANADAMEPSEAELRRFYQDHTDVFQTEGQIKLVALRFTTQNEAEKVATDWVDGALPEALLAAHVGATRLPLPETSLPISSLPRLVGPQLAALVSESERNMTQGPYTIDQGYVIFRLLERTGGSLAAFETIVPTVRQEFLRRNRDTALQTHLEQLRSRAEIEKQPLY
jgi:hypothetical protein